ncbi:HAD family hydrolase [Halocella sp. SP3-1]|uniref:HAD family hydrolase n=1 Tax=Halocella sp. SP3-1 TaxID=2382161 RepID=UPI00197AD0C8|nr:HAD family hydrolase [Halocella sp. SP3-1]
MINEESPQEDRIKQVIKMFSTRGIKVTRDKIIEELENASLNFASRIIKQAIVNLSPDKKIEEYILNNLKYKKELEEPYLNADKILEYLYPKYKIGIIANQSKGSEERLKKYGLWKYISLLFASTELGLEKPDPQIFELALEKANCDLGNAVMVGDRLDNDIGPAKEIGMNTIRILKGFHKVQIPSNKFEKADYEIKELIELKKIV